MSDYDTDIVEWSERQAGLLRRRAANEIDWDNIAEEIEAVGRSQKREVRNRLARLCQHLLKWAFQPELRSRSWRATITTQRHELRSVLLDSPSLVPFVTEALPHAYQTGRVRAEQETGVTQLPAERCPWTAEEVLADGFFPGAAED
jgi:Domain of unknown function DUF29